MRVEGEEAGRFLQGMVTADMEEEREAGRAFYSMMLNAQVRKQGRGGSWWMYVVMRCVVMRCGCVSEYELFICVCIIFPFIPYLGRICAFCIEVESQ